MLSGDILCRKKQDGFPHMSKDLDIRNTVGKNLKEKKKRMWNIWGRLESLCG